MLFELVAESMCNYSHQIGRLPKCRVDLIPSNFNELVNSPEPEPANCSKLVLARDIENLVQKICLPQPLVKTYHVFNLAINLLASLKLLSMLLLIVIDLLPNFFLFLLNIISLFLQIFETLILLFLLLG